MYNEVNDQNTIINANQKKKPLLLFIGIALGLVALVVVLLIVFRNSLPFDLPLIGRQTELTVLVAPATAKIEIDGKEYKNGTYEFPTGVYTATISAEGFETKEVGLVAEAGEVALLYEYLTPTTGKFSLADYDLLKYLSPDEEVTALLKKRAAAVSFLNLLPINDDENQLYFTNESGASDCPADPNLCVGITSLGSVSKDEAIALISKRGYDPTEFTFFFSKEAKNE